MQTESIIATLLAAAAFLKRPIQEMASKTLREAFEVTKAYLREKLGPNPEAVDALDLATEKPESAFRRALLLEESAGAGLDSDAQLHTLVERLAGLLPASAPIGQHVQVHGNGNRIQVAGRDFIHTAKHVYRNAITPDERHLTGAQREQMQQVIAELATRLAGVDGEPNFAGAHRVLQRRFGVASYLLLPCEQFEDALAFLKQQRAIHRSRLLRRHPVAYRNDFFLAIYSGAREIKWDRARVYEFAAKVLDLKQPISSLKVLGPIQLKALAGAIRRQVKKSRSTVAS